MKPVTSPVELLRSLCRACGIDPDTDPVHCITITARACDIPRIVVERYIDTTAASEIVDLVAASGIRPDVVAYEFRTYPA